MSEPEVYLSVRVPGKLKDILEAHVSRDTHMNDSEFVREALREKLQREAPDLYQSLIRVRGTISHGIKKGTSAKTK